MKIKYKVLLTVFLYFSFIAYSLDKNFPLDKNDEIKLYNKALEYEDDGNFIEAIKFYEEYNKIIKDKEKKEKIELKIIRLYPQYDIKVEKYKEFLDKYPKSKFKFLVQYELANLYKLKGNYEKAMSENIKLANLSKGNIYWRKANINIAIIEYELERYELAITILNDLLVKINDYEDLGTVYYLLGMIRIKQLNYKDAEKCFLTCAGSYPQSSKGAASLFELLNIYVLLNKYSEAERITLMLNQLYPDALENVEAKKILEKLKTGNNKKYLEIELININKDNINENNSMDIILDELKNSIIINDKDIENNGIESNRSYYIQLGFYTDLNNSKEVIRVFSSKSVNDAFISKTKSSENSDKVSYRIVIGPFDTKEKANKRLVELKEKNIESIILELYKYYD